MATSGKFDLDQAQYGLFRNNWIWSATATLFEVMSEAGIPAEAMVKMLWLMGISIGHGGRGSDAGIPECPVCGAFGGGGHGGFCPNMSTNPEEWVVR